MTTSDDRPAKARVPVPLGLLVCAVGVVVVLSVGFKRSSQTCAVCMSDRTVRSVGFEWPARALVPISSSIDHETELQRQLLAPGGHVHTWASRGGGFRSLALRRVSHGRRGYGHSDFRREFALSEQMIERAKQQVEAGLITIADIEEALLFSVRGTGSEDAYERVREAVAED